MRCSNASTLGSRSRSHNVARVIEDDIVRSLKYKQRNEDSHAMSLVGEEAPDFELENTAGEYVRLSETLETGPSILVFHRGYWCSFCAEQLQTFSELSYDMWRHLDVDILPIAGDSIPTLVEMRDRFDLRMQLLSDPDFEVSKAYSGVGLHDTYGQFTMAATFVVDESGIVRFEHLSEDAADRVYANYLRYFIRSDYGDGLNDPGFDSREERRIEGR